MRTVGDDASWRSGPLAGGWCVAEGNVPRKPRLLDAVREAIRFRHYSRQTEKAYVGWIRRYILLHGKRHPAAMGPDEVSRFLSSLAVERNVSPSTQNQALAALLFLYGQVRRIDLPWLTELVRTARGSGCSSAAGFV
jgi:hypothetical protein